MIKIDVAKKTFATDINLQAAAVYSRQLRAETDPTTPSNEQQKQDLRGR